MTFKVQLIYFRQTGKYLTTAETTTSRDALIEIWEEIDDMRRLGSLPGLRPGAGRDLLVLVDVPDHPQRTLHLVMATFIDEDDVTPMRIPIGEMTPLVRMPLEEIARTTTRDIVKPDLDAMEADTSVMSDEEVTPIEVPFPRPPDETSR